VLAAGGALLRTEDYMTIGNFVREFSEKTCCMTTVLWPS
jgi:hypothetical protein